MSNSLDGKFAFFPNNVNNSATEYFFYFLSDTEKDVRSHSGQVVNYDPARIPRAEYDREGHYPPEMMIYRQATPPLSLHGNIYKFISK